MRLRCAVGTERPETVNHSAKGLTRRCGYRQKGEKSRKMERKSRPSRAECAAGMGPDLSFEPVLHTLPAMPPRSIALEPAARSSRCHGACEFTTRGNRAATRGEFG